MKVNIDFTNSTFKKIALSSKPIHVTQLSTIDAFFLLIRDIPFRDLDLFCQDIQSQLNLSFSLEEIYKLLQKSDSLSEDIKKNIFTIAMKNHSFGSHSFFLKNGMEINTSSWINHSFNVAIVSKKIASVLDDADEDTCYVLGLLHDVGRKFKTDMEHTVYGFEYLVSHGYENEAIICLTHSHIHGERCANNEPAVPWWEWIDGKSVFHDNQDDLTDFLKNYSYSVYDNIVSIADLMATDKNVMSVYERILKLSQRTNSNSSNKKLFYIELINQLQEFLYMFGVVDFVQPQLALDDITIELLEERLSNLSQIFFQYYQSIPQDTKNHHF